jgi:multiple sugar transport system ATP-binding protein
MASISLRHIYKVYPNGVKAVSDFNMEIHDKEFIVFVGPSGCGKSTTLRMIAGLEPITAGELFIGDQMVNEIEPKDRDVAMVFQNYALYPHMTVYENMAFGLRLRHIPEDEIHRKVLWAAQILKITEYLDRKPKAMSGGQRQRVALGRAILRNPKVFLLDEPLSNLDAKLRTEMRSEISKLHQALQTTFVYVTHDQVEAMTLGTRVVVMKLGRVQQIDTPKNLYNYPENKFVAGFIGTPQMNFFACKMKRDGNKVNISLDKAKTTFETPFNDLLKVRPRYFNGLEPVTMGIRCENLSIDPEVIKENKNVTKVKISHFEELGAETLIYADMNLEATTLADTGTQVIIKSYKGADNIKIGDVIDVAFDMTKAHFFDAKTEKSILPRVPEFNVFDCSVKNGVLSFLKEKITLPTGIKCPDVDKAELFVPMDGMKQDEKLFQAKVLKNEPVGEINVVYLQNDERVFFLLNKDPLKVGSTISLGLDFKRLSIEKDGKDVLKPFPEFDTFLGAFTNTSNEKYSVRSLSKFLKGQEEKEIKDLEQEKLLALAKVSYQPLLRKQAEQAHKDNLTELKEEQAYLIGTEDVGAEGKRRIHEETKAKIEAENKAYEEKKALYDKMEEDEKNLTDATKKASIEKAKKDAATPFEEKIATIKKDYASRLDLIASGYGALQAKKPEDKKEAELAKAEFATITKDYATKKADLTKSYDDKEKEDQALFDSSTGEAKDQAHIKLTSLKTARKNAFRSLDDSTHFAEDEVVFKHKLFYAYIDGYSVLSSQEINRKVVKSLGVTLFKSQFRFEIPHDAFTISPTGQGLKGKVLRIIDFGDSTYAECDANGIRFFPLLKVKAKVGDVLTFDVNLDKGHVIENKFDITLY